ncbi:DNA-directed RNA polymerase subunit omega, partial [Rudaea sp.]|uniref:DNA-directed RNA polymerase subunit omega n=1 Tax=Rudaea sp. TaxID=2136325 RepID=UPI002ED68621
MFRATDHRSTRKPAAASAPDRRIRDDSSPARFLLDRVRPGLRSLVFRGVFMARITVEDCLEVVDNRFELVLMA